jgi:hypothetical protein
VTDVFQETRQKLSMPDVARFYGFTPNHSGFICCPFHREKTASLKVYQGDRGWHCFSCGRGGSVVDFAAQLFHLTPIEAVRRLDQNFHLGLPLDVAPTKEELEKAREAARVAQAHKQFETWRMDFLKELDKAIRVGNLAMKTATDWSDLTEQEALALKWQANFRHWADQLEHGTPEDQMEIFRTRGEIKLLTDQILTQTSQPRSNVS